MIVTDVWPWDVKTPNETGASSKGLAILPPAAQQTLLDTVVACNESDGASPFFKKVDQRTWKMCKFSSSFKRNSTDYVYRLCF